MSLRNPWSLVLATLLALAAASAASAADWPTRPIRIVVPYPAGGGTDLVARMVAPKLSDALKQAVYVENKTGAGGAIGVDAVAKSPPDGHTILFDSLSIVINPIISRVPYDPVRDVQPLAKLISQAFIIVANPKVPAKDLRELVRYSFNQPNGLNAAVPGAATRLAAELFKLTSNARLTFVPYRGGGPATVSVMSGETDLAFMDVPSVAPNVVSGRLRGLAVTSEKRLKIVPDVPTAAEAGMPEYQVASWLGAFLPANTPGDIVARLNSEINAALAAPDVAAKVGQLGGEPANATVAEFTRLYRSEIERWKDVVVRANVKVE